MQHALGMPRGRNFLHLFSFERRHRLNADCLQAVRAVWCIADRVHRSLSYDEKARTRSMPKNPIPPHPSGISWPPTFSRGSCGPDTLDGW